MSKSSPKLPTPEELALYRGKIATGSHIGSRQLAAVFAALDDANARAEAAETRVRDMGAVRKELLQGATLVTGFGDGISTVIGYLRSAISEANCSARERMTVAEIADVFEANQQRLMDEYSANVAPKRVGTIRIEPV